MADSRFNGISIGKYNNFYARTDGAFTSGDTTPDVSLYGLYYSNNSSATTITDFDLAATSQGPGQYEGKQLKYVALDANTTLSPSASLLTTEPGVALAANTVIDFVYHNSTWLETARSVPSATGGSSSQSIAGTTAVGDVTGYSLIPIVGTAATVTIKGISGGTELQEVRLYDAGSGGISVLINTAGNILIEGTNSLVFNKSGVYDFVKRGVTWWHIRQSDG